MYISVDKLFVENDKNKQIRVAKHVLYKPERVNNKTRHVLRNRYNALTTLSYTTWNVPIITEILKTNSNGIY